MENLITEDLFILDTSMPEYLGERKESAFDQIIGHIEDMLVNESFIEMISSFMERYWSEFENGEENKFVYTDIFNEYTQTVENFIDHFLTDRISDFSMTNFLSELQQKKLEMDGEVYEILLTMSDFLMFKEMMLDYKNMKEGLVADFSSDICIKGLCK